MHGLWRLSRTGGCQGPLCCRCRRRECRSADRRDRPGSARRDHRARRRENLGRPLGAGPRRPHPAPQRPATAGLHGARRLHPRPGRPVPDGDRPQPALGPRALAADPARAAGRGSGCAAAAPARPPTGLGDPLQRGERTGRTGGLLAGARASAGPRAPGDRPRAPAALRVERSRRGPDGPLRRCPGRHGCPGLGRGGRRAALCSHRGAARPAGRDRGLPLPREAASALRARIRRGAAGRGHAPDRDPLGRRGPSPPARRGAGPAARARTSSGPHGGGRPAGPPGAGRRRAEPGFPPVPAAGAARCGAQRQLHEPVGAHRLGPGRTGLLTRGARAPRAAGRPRAGVQEALPAAHGQRLAVARILGAR